MMWQLKLTYAGTKTNACISQQCTTGVALGRVNWIRDPV